MIEDERENAEAEEANEAEEYEQEEYEYEEPQYADEEYDEEYDSEPEDEEDYGASDEEEMETDASKADTRAEEPDESRYVMELLDYLSEALKKPIGGGFMSKPHIDVESCLDIVENIRQNIPGSIEYSVRTSTQKERILANAETIAQNKVDAATEKARATRTKAEAEAEAIRKKAKKDAGVIIENAQKQAEEIIAKARNHQKHLVSETEVLKAARKEAGEMRNGSRKEANETRRKAVEDSWKLLDALEKQLNGILVRVEQRKDELLPPDDE